MLTNPDAWGCVGRINIDRFTVKINNAYQMDKTAVFTRIIFTDGHLINS